MGDVAAFPLLCEGDKRVRTEHVTHARDSAAHVVRCILGEGVRVQGLGFL